MCESENMLSVDVVIGVSHKYNFWWYIRMFPERNSTRIIHDIPLKRRSSWMRICVSREMRELKKRMNFYGFSLFIALLYISIKNAQNEYTIFLMKYGGSFFVCCSFL